MKSKLELCEMIYEMYMAAFMAGSRSDGNYIGQARAKRNELLEAVYFMYNELDVLSHDYEELEDDNNRLRELLADENDEIVCMKAKTHLSGIYGSKITDEVPDHHDAFDAMFPGCTPDDLPFPDVEDLESASGLLGGDE